MSFLPHRQLGRFRWGCGQADSVNSLTCFTCFHPALLIVPQDLNAFGAGRMGRLGRGASGKDRLSKRCCLIKVRFCHAHIHTHTGLLLVALEGDYFSALARANVMSTIYACGSESERETRESLATIHPI